MSRYRQVSWSGVKRDQLKLALMRQHPHCSHCGRLLRVGVGEVPDVACLVINRLSCLTCVSDVRAVAKAEKLARKKMDNSRPAAHSNTSGIPRVFGVVVPKSESADPHRLDALWQELQQSSLQPVGNG
ncbi:MAG: hypothetical protein U0941_29785 [Planctomycetaceae bacterium]